MEEVVLIDEENKVLGTMPKQDAHRNITPLHRGFSCFLFKNGKLLLQQRSKKKKTWPCVWSNSVCGHPALGESNVEAAGRRLKFELGITQAEIEEAAPYRYTFVKDGIMENEICPILLGRTEEEPRPNPEEVEAFRWVEWDEFSQETKEHPERYSEWCIEEVEILEKSGKIPKYLIL